MDREFGTDQLGLFQLRISEDGKELLPGRAGIWKDFSNHPNLLFIKVRTNKKNIILKESKSSKQSLSV